MTEETQAPEIPRLSYSVAKTLLTRTPLHAWSEHRLLGNAGRKDTDAMDEGRLMEKFVLGADLDKLVIIDADSWRGKEAQAAKAAAEVTNKQPVLRKHYDEAKAAAEVIVAAFKAKGVDLSFNGDDKTQVFVQHKVTWTSREGVECSGVFDRLELNSVTGYADIYDFKTTTNAATKEFTRDCWKFGYHIQANSYEEAVGVLHPEYMGRTRFHFLIAEKEAPFAVRKMPLAGSMSELGRRAWDEAKTVWAKCLAENVWPGYPDERIEATAWMLAEQMEADVLRGGDFEVVGQLGGMQQ